MGPLHFHPYLRPMVWGGRRLAERLGKSLPDEQPYGESWEVSDHASHHSVVAGGPFQGQTLRQLMTEHREELLGSRAADYVTFPWLIKFLDCHDWLSVQVHPDEQAVKQLWPGEGSKTEAWFVIHAEPGSRIYAGLREGVDEAALRQALAAGTVADCLHAFTPQAGDCIFLPAGTVHAVGGGVLMAEVQQTSDATFRLFDWNRRDAQGKTRELHIEQAMRAIHWNQGPVQPVSVENLCHDDGLGRRVPLVDCPYFRLDQLEEEKRVIWPGGRLRALIVICGSARLVTENAEDRIVTGSTWLIPAAVESIQLVPETPLSVLICSLPQ